MNRPRADTVLVTGCSSGIGRCVAKGLNERGYRVFATARKPDDLRDIADHGLEAVNLELDDSESIRRAVEEVLERSGGRIDGLFNNAAYGQPGAVEDLSREALRAQFETNVFGTHELTCHVVRAMREQGHGRIIQNSSVLGFIALPFRGAYNASKFALEGLSDTLRLELRASNIHVSIIEPGPIRSHFRENAYAAFRRHIDPQHSAHRETYRAVEERLASEDDVGPFTLPPEAVLTKVLHALESRRPKVRYYVTVPTHALGMLKRLLSHRALDRLLSLVARGDLKRG